MQVEDGLPCIGAVIHDQAALPGAVFTGEFGAEADHFADERVVFPGKRGRAAEVFFGDDQEMGGRLGGDIPEGEDVIILIDFLSGNFTVDDFTENTGAGHLFLLVYCPIRRLKNDQDFSAVIPQDTARSGFCQIESGKAEGEGITLW
jgi:hypothetical protein